MKGAFNKIVQTNFATWFVWLSSLFGTAFILFLPPFQNPDEPAHTYRAFHLASGHLFGSNLGTRAGGLVPEWLLELDTATVYLRNDVAAKYHWKEGPFLERTQSSFHFADFPNVSYYAPWGYLPYATIARLSIWLQLEGSMIIYLMRFVGLLLWIIAGSHFLHKLSGVQDFGWLLLLLPGTLAVVTSITPDAFTLTLLLVWMTFILDEKFRKNWYIPLILGVLMVLQKPNWWPLTWLVFLMTRNRWSSWQQWSNILAPMAGSIIYLTIVQKDFISYDMYDAAYRDGLQINPGVNPIQQLRLILEDPIFFLHAFIDTWMDIAGSIVRHLMGKFGWGPNYISWISTIGLLGIVLWSGLTSRVLLHRLEYLFLFWVGVSIVLATSFILYLQWNQVGAIYIHGINGRYLIPVLPLLVLAIPWRYHRIPFQSLILGVVLTGSLVDWMVQVWLRYYG